MLSGSECSCSSSSIIKSHFSITSDVLMNVCLLMFLFKMLEITDIMDHMLNKTTVQVTFLCQDLSYKRNFWLLTRLEVLVATLEDRLKRISA
jgi:hypothetical protein